jgi:hypothetical protein
LHELEGGAVCMNSKVQPLPLAAAAAERAAASVAVEVRPPEVAASTPQREAAAEEGPSREATPSSAARALRSQGSLRLSKKRVKAAAAAAATTTAAEQPPPPPPLLDPTQWTETQLAEWFSKEGFAPAAAEALRAHSICGAAFFELSEAELKSEVGGPFMVLGVRKRLLACRKALMEEALLAAKRAAADGNSGDSSRRLRSAASFKELQASAAFAESEQEASQHEWVKHGNAQPWQKRDFKAMGEKAGYAVVVVEAIIVFVPSVPPIAHAASLLPVLFVIIGAVMARLNI